MNTTIDRTKKTQDDYDNEWLERRKLRREKMAIEPRDDQSDELSLEILNHWNSKGIIVHRKYTKRTPLILTRIMKEFSKEEILKAIDNYVTVCQDYSYFFNHRWKLEEFLQHTNTLPDFVDNGSKWLSYLEYVARRHQPKNKQPVPIEPIKEIVIASADFHAIEETYTIMINTFKAMPYDEYLQTEHWQHFKTEALKASGYRCKMCNTPDDTLHVHHNNYGNRGRETFNDIIVLCGDCHAKFHGK